MTNLTPKTTNIKDEILRVIGDVYDIGYGKSGTWNGNVYVEARLTKKGAVKLKIVVKK